MNGESSNKMFSRSQTEMIPQDENDNNADLELIKAPTLDIDGVYGEREGFTSQVTLNEHDALAV